MARDRAGYVGGVRSRTPGPPLLASMNSTPACSSARRMACWFARVSAVALGISSPRRMVVTLTADWRASSSALQRISAKPRFVCVQAADPLALFLLPLFQPQARAATVLVNEFDAGGFERAPDDIKGRPPRLVSSCLKLPYGDYPHPSFVGEYCLAPVEESSRRSALLRRDH
jgi:hypothetical protein